MKLPRKEGLNIVPFIDIMLVLLAIVLSAASFIAQGQIKINLPESKSAKSVDDSKRVPLSIDKDNKIYFDEQEINIEALREKINSLDKQTTLELRSDSEARFQVFIEIIDILKEENYENFVIQTKIKD